MLTLSSISFSAVALLAPVGGPAPPADLATKTEPEFDLIEVGVCLADIDLEDFSEHGEECIDSEDEGFKVCLVDAKLGVEAYCVARCKGYHAYFVASDDLFELDDRDSEEDCESDARIFCSDNFGRGLKDSCLGLPKQKI